MSDERARATFRALRWHETGGDPLYPACGCCACWEHRTRRQFECKGCGKQFAVTGGTTFRGRTLPFVFRSEDAGVPVVARRVGTGSTVYADEAAVWDERHARLAVKWINHSVAFSDDGACTNRAESDFSRLRRAEFGQHDHISGVYLGFYAGEMAWREDMRREDNGTQAERMTADALDHPKSRNWCGYCQRHVEPVN